MVFGLEKTVEFRWGLKGRKLRYESAKAPGRDAGEEGHEGAAGGGGRDCALDRGPGTIVEIMKPRRDFSLFSHARGETISRMTDCAIPLAGGAARSASSRSHVVTGDWRRAGKRDLG